MNTFMVRARENLFLRTLLIAGVGVLLVGGALTYGLRYPIESAVRRDAMREIVESVRPRILKMVSTQDLVQPITGARYEELDRMIKDYAVGPDVVRLKLWNASGTVVYSTLPAQIGDSYPENEHLQQALQGRTALEVSRETEGPGERALGDLLEVYIPLLWEPYETPVGALEIYLLYAPYASLLASIRNAIFFAVALASLTLPIALYLLYRAGWRSIQRERNMAVENLRVLQSLTVSQLKEIQRLVDLQHRLFTLRERAPELVPSEDPKFLHSRYEQLRKEIFDFATYANTLLEPLLTAVQIRNEA